MLRQFCICLAGFLRAERRVLVSSPYSLFNSKLNISLDSRYYALLLTESGYRCRF